VEQPTKLKANAVTSDYSLSIKKKIAFLLPNLFTTGNLFLGFFSIISATREKWEASALSIMLAAFSDGLDGRIARLTKTESRFGEEYDSMSDLVSFGVAPSLLMFFWALHEHGRWGLFACFFYLTCAALRLTRFNVQKQNVEKRYFQGCPSPFAACTVASAVLFYEDVEKMHLYKDKYMLAIMWILAISMISTFRFRSFKDLHVKSQKGFAYLLVGLVMLVIIAERPELYLFPLALTYVASGPLFEITRFTWKKMRATPQHLLRVRKRRLLREKNK
jgi:CDP-diacylglycerol--serine O-phosphatidyltransferase